MRRNSSDPMSLPWQLKKLMPTSYLRSGKLLQLALPFFRVSANFIALSFEDNLKAYLLFSQLKQYHLEGQIDLQQIIVIERKENTAFAFKDAADLARSNKATKAALIGMAVDISAGPFGVLFGTLTGSWFVICCERS